MLSLTRFPLIAGVFILAQITRGEGQTVEETIANIILQGGIGIATLYIFWQFTRQVAKENERRDAREKSYLELYANQQIIISKMDEADEKKDARWLVQSERNTQAVDALTTLVDALDKRQVFYQETLARVDRGVETINTTGSPGLQALQRNVTTVLERLEEMHVKLDALKADIELKFPTQTEWDSRINDVQRDVEAARKACEEAKRSTNETPTLPAPDITPIESPPDGLESVA